MTLFFEDLRHMSDAELVAFLDAMRSLEREQAARRVNEHIGRYGIPQPDWTQVDAAAWYEAHIAAARGDVADKTGESTGGHGGLVSRASFLPSSTATVHNIDNPDAIVNVRNAAVVNISQTQNVNVWTDVAAARGEDAN